LRETPHIHGNLRSGTFAFAVVDLERVLERRVHRGLAMIRSDEPPAMIAGQDREWRATAWRDRLTHPFGGQRRG
jgi:hypothetical protein